MSKYSEELFINALPNSVSFSATNTSLSAYCRFTYERSFFTKFNVGNRDLRDGIPDLDDTERSQTVTGQLCVQPLLAILKHKALEKTLERLDLIVVDGVFNHDDEGFDGLEGKLIIRLHCKHGIVKTHRLTLQTPSSQLHLHVPEALNESHVAIGPKAMRDMIDHFPSTRGKADPQLIWVFDDTEVHIRSLENSLDGKGVGQLATELTISADEFENYDIFATPISLAFHLREFNATIAYVESMEAVLNVRFTDPAAALYVNVQSDSIESLFAMSTSRVPGAPEPPEGTVPRQTRSAEPSGPVQGRRTNKRPSDETTMRRRTPAKVVQRVSPPALARLASGAQPSAPSHTPARDQPSHPVHHPRVEPLFLPASQMSAADKEALHASGLGDMDADEFNAMMEDDGEEVGLNLDPPLVDAPVVPSVLPMSPSPTLDLDMDEEQGHSQGVNRFEDDIESEMGPTQSDESGKVCPSTYPFRVCTKKIRPDRPCVRVHGRRSDRCSTTDAHPVLSSKPRHGLLFPIAETSGIQPSLPEKTYITLNHAPQYSIITVVSLYVLSMCSIWNSFPHCPAPGLAVSFPPHLCVFSHNLPAISAPCQVENARYSMMRGKRVAIVTNVHGCDASSEEKGSLGIGHGRSRQTRVTIFETALSRPFSPSSYIFFIYFPGRKAYLLSRMHPIP